MRTTLNIDDRLMRLVKARAAETGRTVTSIVETALRELLDRELREEATPYKLTWTVVPGGAQPGVDLADRDSLYDRMADVGDDRAGSVGDDSPADAGHVSDEQERGVGDERGAR